ncbi:hypothetical protein LPJ75_005234 [Coemansia sp. RSA 2598]|nr:hypothetical protein LPJ75_005234 [Coemansia sp. RSA 2598]
MSSQSSNRAGSSRQTALRRQQQVLSHLQGEKQAVPTQDPKKTIRQIAVYGAGIMGSGIAQVAAQAGYKVVLWDMRPADIERGMAAVKKSLERTAKRLKKDAEWVNQTLGLISTTTDQLQACSGADLVIEAIVEDLRIKQKLFGSLDQAAKPDCIFATNTSSLLVRDVAASVGDDRKKRTVALHFFNPVAMMKLVEIAYMDGMDERLLELLKAWVRDIGKTPVLCRDTPGFIVNRLLVPYNSEARMLVERGDATIEDVDTAMKLGAGYPMGPFELMDMTGLDTGYHIMKGWYEGAPGLKGDIRFKPTAQMEQMVKDGHLGRKTGQGYYKYN